VLILLSLSGVTNLILLVGVCAACMLAYKCLQMKWWAAVTVVAIPSQKTLLTTVFDKHCACIAQKCTHLERLPPLTSQLLLLSHCVRTQHGGPKKQSHFWGQTPGIKTGSRNNTKYGLVIYAIRSVVSNGSYCIREQ